VTRTISGVSVGTPSIENAPRSTHCEASTLVEICLPMNASGVFSACMPGVPAKS
jgi:hypothetical protein